jgi:hypothetical protein
LHLCFREYSRTKDSPARRRCRRRAIGDELSASVGQARAALAAATADHNNVYAGVRAEQIASLAAEIAKARSQSAYAEQQGSRIAYLARNDNASQQMLDQVQNDAASARANVAEAQANHASRRCGRIGRNLTEFLLARGHNVRASPPQVMGFRYRQGARRMPKTCEPHD